jgi:hydrogenase-1 operon protein HyaE
MIAMQTTSPEATHPLIAQLFGKHGFAEVNAADFDTFTGQPGHRLLVFLEDPLRVRETLDLAVILPELAQAFAGRFTVGILLPATARSLYARYAFRRWPALVLFRDGQYVGAIDGLREWNEYVTEMSELLAATAKRPPTIGITVTTANAASANRTH